MYPAQWSTLKRLIFIKRAIHSAAKWILATVTGASPITLQNAVVGEIGVLTQYGKCETRNGDIYCNNGVLKARHQSGLPTGYQLLDYLMADKSIETPHHTTDKTEIRGSFYREQTNAQYLYYSDSSTSGNSNTTAYITAEGNWRFNGNRASLTINTGVDIVSVQNKDGVWLNGEKVGNYGSVGAFTSVNTLRIFGTVSSSQGAIRCKWLEHYEDGVLIAKYLPVQEMSDNTYGLYDLVGDAFYTNPEAVFTPGSFVDDPVEIYADGTPETLTVSATGETAQTVTDIPNLFSTLDGSVKDEIEIVSGAVTRRTEAVYEDGGIVVKALAEPVTEQTTPHSLHTARGANIVSVESNVDPVMLEVFYAANPAPDLVNVQNGTYLTINYAPLVTTVSQDGSDLTLE